MPQNIADMLSSSSSAAIDAHAVQPYYTRLLAQACGLNVTLAPEGERCSSPPPEAPRYAANMVNQMVDNGRLDSLQPSYLFVEAVLFHLLNQY